VSHGQCNRLARGGDIRRDRPLRFRFNGREYQGFEGDTLASALLANGVGIVGRSFKYSRARGVFATGPEEPNAIVQLGSREATQVPNVRATEQCLYEGLEARSTKGWPSVERDLMGVFGKLAGRFMPVGFYYKTFMAPRSQWPRYEAAIRKLAGLGRAPCEPDPDIYDHMHHHCDVLVIGGGPAGLMAAQAAVQAGARVIIAEQQPRVGGHLLDTRECVGGLPGPGWAEACRVALRARGVLTLVNTVAYGLHDHGHVTLNQTLVDPYAEQAPRVAGVLQVRQRVHKVRAAQVILATGTHERPLVYANNDVPGNMLAGAVGAYVNRYAVAPGHRLVLSVTNDHAYRTAIAWQRVGRRVVAVVDARARPEGTLVDEARALGLRIIPGSAVIEAVGRGAVRGARIAGIDRVRFRLTGRSEHVACDLIASSGGYSPVVHLAAHTGVRPVWREDLLGFVPGEVDGLWPAGGVNGVYPLAEVLADGRRAGMAAAAAALAGRGSAVEPTPALPPLPAVRELREGGLAALYQVPHEQPTMRAPKQFVDLQNDVTAAGIELATREGYESIEHVKRYTALGFGTDQGKLGNINGMAIVARCLNQSIPETGTTMFRPNYTPVAFGAIVGRHCNALFDPERRTPMHRWHVARGAVFEPVGQWLRPQYYPLPGETMEAAVRRECLAVRERVGILDASTLGKIDIQGPDARTLLDLVYTNAWSTLPVGRGRYGLMCKDDGMIMDDGVSMCLADDHFRMTTTTGGAAAVLEWLELWLQTEWPHLKVYLTSVTDQWATIALNGPRSRELLAPLTDIDLAPEAFPFMAWRGGAVAGVPAQVCRISFTGELAFEINVQADVAQHVWDALLEAGAPHGITPYGTEAMHVLRAEKGYIIVGQDTDGSVTAEDLGLHWAVDRRKPLAWIGKRALSRPDTARADRKHLVGLKPSDPAVVLPEGGQLVRDPQQARPIGTIGHVTSSYFSPTLGHGFALALLENGRNCMGRILHVPMADGQVHAAEVVSPLFYDPSGERQRG